MRALRRVPTLVRRAIGGAVVVLVALYLALLAAHLQPMVIVTGSMQKTIPVGSLVVDQTVAPASLKVGDVISFEKPIGAREVASHRIIEITRSGRFVAYRTKGDSNPVADPWAITFSSGMKAHRVLFHLPDLGYLLMFAHSRLGVLLVVAYTCFTLIATILKVIAEAARPKEDRAHAAT